MRRRTVILLLSAGFAAVLGVVFGIATPNSPRAQSNRSLDSTTDSQAFGNQPHHDAGSETGEHLHESSPADASDSTESRKRVSITGIVVDSRGAAVPDATVRVLSWSCDDSRLPQSHLRINHTEGDVQIAAERELGQTQSGADGRFVITPKTEATYDICAEADGYGRTRLRRVQLGADVRIELASAVSVEVHVKDSDGGPLRGTIVLRVQTGFAKPYFEMTRQGNLDGKARFDGIPARHAASLEVRAPAHANAYRRFKLPQMGTKIEIVRLEPGARVTGVVRSASTGLAIEGAAVGRLITDDFIRTDALGRFVLENVDPKLLSVEKNARPVEVWAPGFALRRFTPVASSVEIVLTPLHNVRGNVVDANGRPVSGAHIRVVSHSAESGEFARKGRVISEETGESDESGEYRIRAGVSGHVLSVFASSQGCGVAALDMRLDPDASETVVPEIVLLPALTIRGTVIPPEGRSLGEVSLWLHGEDFRRRSMTWARPPGTCQRF